MNKKAFYLFIALLLPGLIFLFLKFFGKNEFDIQVYYDTGVTDAPPECSFKSNTQYLVPDSVLKNLHWNKTTALIVDDSLQSDLRELAALLDKLKATSACQTVGLSGINRSRIQTLRSCVLFLKQPYNAVLIDNQKRIRGYYKLGNRDETDRLEVELKILLKQY